MRRLGRLEQSFSWYNPVESRLVIPRRTDSGGREALVLDAHPADVRRIVHAGAATLPEVAERLATMRTVSEDVEVRGGRRIPLDAASPSPEALSLAASLEDNPCWVKGVNLRTSFLTRIDHVIEDYSEDNYLFAEHLDPRDSCVIYDVREFTNPGRLLFWRGHLVNEGGSPEASNAEVSRFAREKLVEHADQTLDLIQERLEYPCDTFVVRVSQRGDAQGPVVAGDYLVSGIGDLDAVLSVALGSADRSMTRVEDSRVDGTLITYDDGALAQVRMAREADVSPSTLVPTARPWVRLCVDRSLFDSRSRPTLVGEDFYRTYPDGDDLEATRGAPAPEADAAEAVRPSDMGSYLAQCLDAFLAEGVELDPESRKGVEAFCEFVASPACSVPHPQPDSIRLRTPDGDLVARAQDFGDYRSIVVDLERPDGNSGQVCMAEWVAESERGPAMEFSLGEDGRIVAHAGSEPLYPTPFHTFSYDGEMDDPAAAVDLNPTGAEMWYSPRSDERGEPARNASLSESFPPSSEPTRDSSQRGAGREER